MQTLHERCCGLDVHKKTVVACVITPEGQETQTFGTMTFDLLKLSDWLTERGVTHVAMESSGVYWRPIYNLLEDSFTLVVVNARHMHAVPGRKTDVKDAEWIADLLRHGLLKASFIPNRWQRELRELVRYRKTLVEERSRLVTRVQKVLESANIKIGDVITNVVGKSGRAMLVELAGGSEDVAAMADLALGTAKAKRPQLQQALAGSVGPHQRFMLQSQIRLIEQLEAEIEAITAQVEEGMRPFQAAVALLDEIPGVGPRTAEQVLAETGIDMTRFKTSAHFASWARVCPGNNQSGGRRRQAATGQGNPYLRTALIDAALGAVRAGRRQPNFFSARYHRLVVRRGSQRAAMAVAHSMLVAIYRMLLDGAHFEDLGPDHFDERRKESLVRNSVRKLQELGFKVTLEEAA
jgi:transposase